MPEVAEAPRVGRDRRLIIGLVALIVGLPLIGAAAIVVPAGSLLVGLAIAGIVLLVRRIDARRLEQLLDAGLIARGDSTGAERQLSAFAIAPTLTLFDGIREVQAIQGQTPLAEPPSRRAKLLVFVDRHVLSIDDAQKGRLLTLPASHITAIWPEYSTVRSLSSKAKSVPSLRIRVEKAGGYHDLVLSPSGDFTHRVKDTEVDQIAGSLRAFLDLEYPGPE